MYITHIYYIIHFLDFPDGSFVKNLPTNARDAGRSPGARNGNPLQTSGLENSMDRGAWWTIVQGTAKSWTWLEQLEHTHNSTFMFADIYVCTHIYYLVHYHI